MCYKWQINSEHLMQFILMGAFLCLCESDPLWLIHFFITMYKVFKSLEGVSEVFALALKPKITTGYRDSTVYVLWVGQDCLKSCSRLTRVAVMALNRPEEGRAWEGYIIQCIAENKQESSCVQNKGSIRQFQENNLSDRKTPHFLFQHVSIIN